MATATNYRQAMIQRTPKARGGNMYAPTRGQGGGGAGGGGALDKYAGGTTIGGGNATHEGISLDVNVAPNPYMNTVGGLAGAITNRYRGQADSLAGRAAQLGTQDFTGEMVEQANYASDKAESRQDAAFRRLGAPELALQQDIQDDRSDARNRAVAQAKINAEEMRMRGMQTAVNSINSLSRTDLDAAMSQIQAYMQAAGLYAGTQSLAADMLNAKTQTVVPMASAMGAGAAQAGGNGRQEYGRVTMNSNPGRRR